MEATEFNPEIHKNVKKEAIPCWRCKQEYYITLQWGTLSEPLKGDITARYCAQCQSVYPPDANRAKYLTANKKKGRK
jgi:hypothetical protein